MAEAVILRQPHALLGPSRITDLKQAIGQFIVYRSMLRATDPDRHLYLAINTTAYDRIFATPLGQPLLTDEGIKLVVFDPQREVIVTWIPVP